VLTDLSSAVRLVLDDVQKFGTVAPYFSAYYHLLINPGDFKGLRIRSLGGLGEDMFRVLGAEPTMMPPADRHDGARADRRGARGLGCGIGRAADQEIHQPLAGLREGARARGSTVTLRMKNL